MRQPTRILGISAFFHDSAAALVVDGQVVAAAQEERFTRRKGDASFPATAIEACLQIGEVAPDGLDAVVFYEQPVGKFHRLLRTWRSIVPAGWPTVRAALPEWARHRLDPRPHLRRALGSGFDGPVHVAAHHESHAASAYYPSPFDSAAIVVMDAVGERATSSIAVGTGARIEMLLEQRFPHSLGMLYSAFTHYVGFRVNSGEYKLMGLAPYGEPRYVDTIRSSLVEVQPDGSLRLNMDHFAFHRGHTMVAPSFERLLGRPARTAEMPFTQHDLDVAASIQQVCEEVVLRTAAHAAAVTGERRLALAGGVALNCVANGRLLREAPFDDVWVQPAAGDAGGALGAALLEWHHVRGHGRRPRRPDGQHGSLLGPSFDDDDVELFLAGAGAQSEHLADEERLLAAVVELLAAGNVVGWFQGAMEFGPRALGNRSILADPRDQHMQQLVNHKIKFRESFRPFAPSVLREHAHEVFDVPEGIDSPYMLFAVPIRADRRRPPSPSDRRRMAHPDPTVRVGVPRSDLPAITHVDHTARLQTVDRHRHGRYRRLLERFHARTGCPALLNTSFNVRGEPVVHSPRDAYRCFMSTDMDALVLGSHLLRKDDQGPPDPAVMHPHTTGGHSP